MSAFLGTAIVSITLALVFYTIGTWAERIQGVLKLWHIAFFILGLCADTLGTALMSQIAAANGSSMYIGGSSSDILHAITGLLAIILMAIHALWAVWTYWKGTPRAKQNFSKFSVFVWAFWLIPYIGGVLMGTSF